MAKKSVERTGSRLGNGSEARGRLTGAGDLEVRGALSGELDWDGLLVVAEGAVVEADGRVSRLDLRGSLRGQVRLGVDGIVRRGASWIGSGSGPSLASEAGARLEGSFAITPDAPQPAT